MARSDFIHKPHFLFSLAALGIVLLLVNLVVLTGIDFRGHIKKIKTAIPIHKLTGGDPPSPPPPKLPEYNDDKDFDSNHQPFDNHPIVKLTKNQLHKFAKYQAEQKAPFKTIVANYRKKHGRHPPPDFDKWYTFAKQKGSVIFDGFDQINDDLRPYWAIAPQEIRRMVRKLVYDPDSRVAVIHTRKHGVTPTTRGMTWRMEMFEKTIRPIAHLLPDLDIAVNRLEEPRVIVPWEDIQAYLKIEEGSRSLSQLTSNGWSRTDWDAMNNTDAASYTLNLGFFDHSGKPYMDLVKKACPPDSYARNPQLIAEEVEATYMAAGNLITNFNRSSDLCTVGPRLEDAHGFLFSSLQVKATHKLVPIFSQSKVNVNNDILFPAAEHFEPDTRYSYDGTDDVDWKFKKNTMIWRGHAASGLNTEETWQNMHRARFVAANNATILGGETRPLLGADEDSLSSDYEPASFRPASFIKRHSDVGFTDLIGCKDSRDQICEWMEQFVQPFPALPNSQWFASKYLPDIDTVTFSPRWYAVLKSKGLGMKATIFREWHDSRLFEWAHFVPMDNRFEDLYSLLTYYIGLGATDEGAEGVYVPQHNFDAKDVADRGRDWANKALRVEDIEVYMYRLMLEYARIVDDNRDNIGYTGDGSGVR